MLTKPRPFSRAPAGVITGRPVLMRLLPHEREALQRHAAAANASLSATARRMTLAGLTQCACINHAKCVNSTPAG